MRTVLAEVVAPVRASEGQLRAFLVGERMPALTGARPAGPRTAAIQRGWWYRGEVAGDVSEAGSCGQRGGAGVILSVPPATMVG